MKKKFLFIITICAFFIGKAQVDGNTTDHFHYSFTPVKARVYVNKRSSYRGVLTEISDTAISMICLQSRDSGTYLTIAVKDIRRIRVKRNALMIGSVYGGGSGFLLGGLMGLGAFTDKIIKPESAFLAGGIIGLIPGMIAGAGIGSVTVKGRFRIKGNKGKINKLGKILTRRDKLLHG